MGNPSQFDIESTEYFYAKPGDGGTFGLTLMAVCTLSSPDVRIFFTATTRPSFGYAQFQMYTPRFSHTHLVPDEQVWVRDSLKAVNAGVFNLPVLGHINVNINGDAVNFGLGLSLNMMKLDQRKEFNRVSTIIVAEDFHNPTRLDNYDAYYKLSSYVKIEMQLGFIWTGHRDRQHEAYVSASIGKGKQGSVLLGYFWRFNFYHG